MELYGANSRSLLQKIVIVFLELALLCFASWILFYEGGSTFFGIFGFELSPGNLERRALNFAFSILTFLRMCVTLFYLLKRKIPWEEAISVPMAFALYYVGFALLTYASKAALGWIDFVAVGIFVIGSLLNTISEMQRHFWKLRPENKGKLYTRGLFKYSMHINYFGDMLWVVGYAIVSRNYYSIGIPGILLLFFTLFNIPKLDAYLNEKYKEEFLVYRKKTARLIPFVY